MDDVRKTKGITITVSNIYICVCVYLSYYIHL